MVENSDAMVGQGELCGRDQGGGSFGGQKVNKALLGGHMAASYEDCVVVGRLVCWKWWWTIDVDVDVDDDVTWGCGHWVLPHSHMQPPTLATVLPTMRRCICSTP